MIARCGGLSEEKKILQLLPEQNLAEVNGKGNKDIKQENFPEVNHEEQCLILKEKISSYTEPSWPLEIRVNQHVILKSPLLKDDTQNMKLEQLIITPDAHKITPDMSLKCFNESSIIYPATIEEVFSSPSPDSSTASTCSSVIQFAHSNAARPQCGVLWEESNEKKEVTEKPFRDNLIMPFTLEEEFKVYDFIVRIEDYIEKRYNFINTNFGDNAFPNYSELTKENAVCTSVSGKVPYNPVMEERLFNLGLKFTQLNINHFFDEMKCLSEEVKEEMLKTSLPSTFIILYAILENNNWRV